MTDPMRMTVDSLLGDGLTLADKENGDSIDNSFDSIKIN
jgi:hypothetical protein